MKLKHILWPWRRIKYLEQTNEVLEKIIDLNNQTEAKLREEIGALKSRERMMARKTESDVSSNEKLARLTRTQEIALYHATARLEAERKKLGNSIQTIAIDDIPKPQS